MSRGSPWRARGEPRGLNQAAAGLADPYPAGPDAGSESPAGFQESTHRHHQEEAKPCPVSLFLRFAHLKFS